MRHLINLTHNPATRRMVLLAGSSVLIAAGWLAGSVLGRAGWFDALMIGATLLAGTDILQRAWRGLLNRHTNIELLVSIAAAGGLAIGIYWEAAAVTFLFLLGGWLEARTLNRTRNTLNELINLAPDTAIVMDGDDQQHEIPASEAKTDDLVLVKPGAKIPVDGLVERGHSAVDESTITGESVPVEKQTESEVYAGTINQSGMMVVRVTGAGADTTLARIIRRVEEAQEAKAPTQRFIERFANWYTPSIMGLSLATLLFTGNLETALTLLVIACPGALVISTPISIITGIGRAASKGILIKGGEFLEQSGRITAIAFDKTGTLTEGRPKVTEIVNFRADQEEFREILYWAAIVESASGHPLADAILKEVTPWTAVPEAESFQSYAGLGVEANYRNHHILAGNREFMQFMDVEVENHANDTIAKLAESGQTVVLIALDGQLSGALGISDTLRPEAAGMIRRLRENGLQHIIMLTGDTPDTAEAIGRKAGITEVRAGLLPDDKHDHIQQLQKDGHRVAMIGDGINDAPALARADIGIAMGAAGTDVAIETADIALMSDDLLKIPEALRLSRLTMRNIYQNVTLALLTVALLLTGVFMGSVHMAAGMLIHELSVMVVILNGVRLKWA